MEQKHVRTIDGDPEPADIFEPHMPGVELLSDMDALFEGARRLSATGEYPSGTSGLPPEAAAKVEEFKGQRSVVVVTPGRMLMPVPAPVPGSMSRQEDEGMRKLFPPDPPLIITVISYTYVKALIGDMTKAIPFLRFLAAFAATGHTVTVFEGHPSAFESGVRASDVLMVDSGMMPFLQGDWKEVAFRVMRPEAKVLVHDRPTHNLVQHFRPGVARAPLVMSPEEQVSWYAGTLIRLLLIGPRTSVELTSGEPLPNLADFATTPAQQAEIASLPFRPDQLDADKVIESILQGAGWRPLSIFKTTGVVRIPLASPDGKPLGMGACGVKLSKAAGGRRRILLER